MNKQQLQTARLSHWSQNGDARLTLDDVRAWLETIHFCPVAPLRLPGNPPMPTLLEASLGKPLPEPTLAERAIMQPLLARLVQAKATVPLLLISPAGEQPDFVANLEALPFLYAMRGDREWKTQPAATGQGRVSQLALHCWQELDKNGPQTLRVLQSALGSEITQAAVLRALCELWGHLRVYPQLQVEDAGENVSPAWELLARSYPKQVSIGSTMGQQAALSGILSLYLSAVIAASDEEIVSFLSPLASQSRTREMVHGLTATRQLGRVPFEGGMLLHLKDGLSPELLVELPAQEEAPQEGVFTERSARGPIRKWEPRSRPERPGYPARSENRMHAERRPEREDRAQRPPGNFSNEKKPRKFPEKFAAGKFEPKRFRSAKPTGEAQGAPQDGTHGTERPGSRSPLRPVASGRPAFGPSGRPAFRSKPGGGSGRPFKKSGNKPFQKKFDSTSRPGQRFAASGGDRTDDARPRRDFGGDRPQKPWQRRNAGGFQPAKTGTTKAGFAKAEPSQRSASKYPSSRPAGRPSFRSESGAVRERPFQKRFDAKPGPRKNFSPVNEQGSEQGSERKSFRTSEPQDRPQGGWKPVSARAPAGAARRSAPKSAWKKNGTQRDVPKDDARRGPRSYSKTGSKAAPKTDWGKSPSSDGPAKARTGKPSTSKFGRDKAGSHKADDGKPSVHTPVRKEPFWAKPMHPKRKKKDD